MAVAVLLAEESLLGEVPLEVLRLKADTVGSVRHDRNASQRKSALLLRHPQLHSLVDDLVLDISGFLSGLTSSTGRDEVVLVKLSARGRGLLREVGTNMVLGGRVAGLIDELWSISFFVLLTQNHLVDSVNLASWSFDLSTLLRDGSLGGGVGVKRGVLLDPVLRAERLLVACKNDCVGAFFLAVG